MKVTIIAMRHGAAQSSQYNLKDFDRALTDIGKKEVTAVAQQLQALNINPTITFVSASKRTRETATIVANLLNTKISDSIYLDKLYLCPPEIIEEIIATYNNTATDITILIIGHNPGLSTFVSEKLTNYNFFFGLNTSHAAILKLEVDQLASIYSAQATLHKIIKPV